MNGEVDELIIKNEELVGSKIIEAKVESKYSSSYIVIITPNGKKYSISPECEDSQSATWFDFVEIGDEDMKCKKVI